MECYLADPDMVLVFGIYLGVLKDGTRLAMPKTIYVLDSSSLKPGSGATEGVLDKGVSRQPDYALWTDCWTMKNKIEDFVPCPDGTLLGVEGKLGDSDVDLLLCKPTLCNPSPLRCLYKPEGLVCRTHDDHHQQSYHRLASRV